MDKELTIELQRICERIIEEIGAQEKVSFYDIFSHLAGDSKDLMSIATWWIDVNNFPQFETLASIRQQLSVWQASCHPHNPSMASFNHLTLSVKNLGLSLDFYCDLLGFDKKVVWRKGAYLSYGDFWLCLSVGDSIPSKDYSHFAISASLKSMEELRRNKAFNGKLQWKQNISEGDSLYLLDPDGHKLELHNGHLQSRLEALKKHPYDDLVWFI